MHAAERDTERVKALRRAFIEAVQDEDVTRFKFVDETSLNLTYTRRYGRAPGGQRVDAAVPQHNGANDTIVAVLSAQGVEELTTPVITSCAACRQPCRTTRTAW